MLAPENRSSVSDIYIVSLVTCKVFLQLRTELGLSERQNVSWARGLQLLLHCSFLVNYNKINCFFGFYFYMYDGLHLYLTH